METEATGMKHRARDIDKCIGSNLQKLRLYKNMSQAEVAGILGVTFQQVQKYENGVNRLSAGRLYSLHQYFGVPLAYFFSGYRKEREAPFYPEIDLPALQILLKMSSVRDPGLRGRIVDVIDILVS